MRRPAGRERAVPRRRRGAPWSTSTSTGSARSALRQGTFDDNRRTHGERIARVPHDLLRAAAADGDIGLRRKVDRFPFVPDDVERLALDCYEAYNIQVSGLEQRLHAIGQPKVVIGVSGGLDSTHALIVAAKAMDRLGRPRTDIHAFTMPGFATGDDDEVLRHPARQVAGRDVRGARHHRGRQARCSPISTTRTPTASRSTTSPSRTSRPGLRTDYLFRLANHRGGIVLGTGDLSELALGWCTYGVGDQMSHYNVNAGVPKTLIQHLIRWVSDNGEFAGRPTTLLREIVEQEITPELIPTAEDDPPQSTEPTVGPYSLQDFTLFHVLRFGYRPSKIAFLAWHAWRDAATGWPPGFPDERRVAYDLATVRRWLVVFVGGSSPASSSGPRCRTGRRSAPAARCRRAATGGCRRTRRHGVAGRAGGQRPRQLNVRVRSGGHTAPGGCRARAWRTPSWGISAETCLLP